jgi:hypothetical protein
LRLVRHEPTHDVFYGLIQDTRVVMDGEATLACVTLNILLSRQ